MKYFDTFFSISQGFGDARKRIDAFFGDINATFCK